MVDIANIQKTLYFSSKLDSEQRDLLGVLILEEIIKRTTSKGIDVKSRPFKKYSEGYKDSFEFKLAGKKKPNLKLTGSMVHSIKVISHTKGEMIIGYEKGDDEAGKVEGNQIGSYGQSTGNNAKKREFIGLPKKVIKVLVGQVQSSTISKRLTEERSIADQVFGRVNVNRPEEA